MVTYSKSNTSTSPAQQDEPPYGWLKVGVIAAASALAGGLAAAWWYRKTLKKLRQTDETGQNSQFCIPADNPSDED